LKALVGNRSAQNSSGGRKRDLEGVEDELRNENEFDEHDEGEEERDEEKDNDEGNHADWTLMKAQWREFCDNLIWRSYSLEDLPACGR
jgi:hypothetical protein